MRDLAQSHSFVPRKSSKFPPRILRIILVVFVISGAIYFAGNAITGRGVVGGESVHDAPAGLTPVEVSGAPISVAGGVNLSSDTITLKNVAGADGGTATATRVYGNGGYTLTVSATLPDPHANRYQVWLSDGTKVYDANFMDGSKTSWSDTFRDTDKYSKVKNIWITREITSEDNKPERHIMEGSF